MIKYLYKLYSNVIGRSKIVWSFLRDTSVADVTTFKESVDKPLTQHLLSWVIDVPLRYAFIGLMISFSLTKWFPSVNWFDCAITYWLLFKVIRSLRGDN
jgi:hypothetical protein